MVSLSLSLSIKAGDEHNHVTIDQVNSSDNFNLSIEQIGYENLARFSFDHDNNTVNLLQSGNHMYFGYTDSWNDNDFQFHIWGSDNKVIFGQGYENNNSVTPNWNYDGNEPGGNFVRLDIHGNNNTFKGSQKMDSSSISHSITANIYSNNNDVYVKQMQNGNKTFTLTIQGASGNDVAVVQKNNGAHTATVSLTGAYPTDLSLTQSGNNNQTYSLTQNCQTANGCNVSVTQN